MNLLSWHPFFRGCNIRVPFISAITFSKHLLFLKLPHWYFLFWSSSLPQPLPSSIRPLLLGYVPARVPKQREPVTFSSQYLPQGAFTSLSVVAVSNSIVLVGTEANGVINYLLSAGLSLENNQYVVLVIHSSSSSLPGYCRLLYPLQTQQHLRPSKRLNNSSHANSSPLANWPQEKEIFWPQYLRSFPKKNL